MGQTFTLIDDGQAKDVRATVHGGRVQLEEEQVRSALGWQLKPEGLCRGGACIPVRDPAALRGADGLDLEELARQLGRPLALDVEQGVAALAEPPEDRASALASLEAPDFTLPDLGGKLHSLSAYRGKKVLLIAYASW
jgi:hypothetical protein